MHMGVGPSCPAPGSRSESCGCPFTCGFVLSSSDSLMAGSWCDTRRWLGLVKCQGCFC